MSVFPSSQATIDLQVLPTFPANVVATGAVDISKSGLTYTFGLNFQNVIEETNVSDLCKRELLAQDTDTGAFWRIKLANLPPSPHTHPVSQISDATPLGQALVTALDTATAQTTLNVPPNTRTISAGTGLTGGGDLSADRTLSLADMPQATVKGRAPGAGAGAPQDLTITQVLDALGTAQGSVIYRGASGWAALGAGAAGQVLTSGGAGADPSWKTATAAAIDAGILAGFRNKIINGDGRINQRGASSGISDDEYAHDRHYALTQSADITVSTLTAPADGIAYMMRLTQSDASAQRMGYAQILEAAETYGLRGKTVTLGGKLRYSNAAAVRFAVLEWTGTADTVTSDVVLDWTSGTYTAGNFFLASNLTVAAVGSITPSADTITDWSLTATISSSANNIIVFYWTEGTAAQNSTLDMRWYLVEGDATAEADPFSPRHIQQELALCQRYYAKTLDSIRFPASGTGQLVNAHIHWPVPMRAAPTTTLTSPQTNLVSSASLRNVSTIGARFEVVSSGAGDVYSLNAEITADAEL